jgi:hypothetical protein
MGQSFFRLSGVLPLVSGNQLPAFMLTVIQPIVLRHIKAGFHIDHSLCRSDEIPKGRRYGKIGLSRAHANLTSGCLTWEDLPVGGAPVGFSDT